MKAKDLISTPIEDLTFSVIDVETTGMHAEFNRVMDIGLVKVRNGKMIEEWETLVNPRQEIPYYITRFTHLAQKHVFDKPEFSVVAKKLDKNLRETVFVAHNVYFDYWFLWFEMKRVGIPLDMPKLCTVMLGRKLTPNLVSANLDSLTKYYHIDIDNRHRALPDARAAAELLIKFIDIARDKYKVKNYFDLYNLQWMRTNGEDNFGRMFGESI